MIGRAHASIFSGLPQAEQAGYLAGGGDGQDEVATKARALAEVILAECADVALGRAAAELFACAACIGGDTFAVQLLRALNTAAAESTSSSRCACQS